METLEPLVIQTQIPNLTLRQLRPPDAFPILALVRRNIDHLRTLGDEKPRELRDIAIIEHRFSIEHPTKKHLGIWSDLRLIGAISLVKTLPVEAEVGYWLGKEHCGRGFATIAVEALVSHAFAHMGLGRIFAIVRKGNEKSRKVLLRAGFSLASSHGDGFRFVRNNTFCGLS